MAHFNRSVRFLHSDNVIAALNSAIDDDKAQRIARRWVRHTYGMECGIEGMTLPNGDELQYVNRGDTYDATLCCVGDVWQLSSWGDCYEQSQSERYDDTGEQCCCCCGEYAKCEEHSGKNWQGYACEMCRS